MDAKKTILLIEDEPALRDLSALALGRCFTGCRILTAGDAAEALRHLDASRPIAIILEILLPQMNGLEFVRRLKTRLDMEAVPVIVTSALGYPEVVRQAREAGVKDFIIKPYDVDTLAVRVKQALDQPLSAGCQPA